MIFNWSRFDNDVCVRTCVCIQEGSSWTNKSIQSMPWNSVRLTNPLRDLVLGTIRLIFEHFLLKLYMMELRLSILLLILTALKFLSTVFSFKAGNQ